MANFLADMTALQLRVTILATTKCSLFTHNIALKLLAAVTQGLDRNKTGRTVAGVT